MEGENNKSNHNRNQKKRNIDDRVGNHVGKTERSVLACCEFAEIINQPAADNCIKRHQSEITGKADPAKDAPLLAGLLQSAVHIERTALRGSSNREFHGKSRDTEDNQADDINQHEAAAAVLPTHPGEFPYISAADCTAGG